jgi:myo-inositol-1(or 4)-monophosphatase
MLCTGFPYDVHDSDVDNLDHFARLVKKARAIRRDGAAALDLCYVAAGRFDGFWEMKLKPWDMAAGALIVTEAGGRVSGFDGSGLGPGPGAVLATNGPLHSAMLDILALGRS